MTNSRLFLNNQPARMHGSPASLILLRNRRSASPETTAHLGAKSPLIFTEIHIGDDEVVEKYGVLGFPTTYILDKDFKIHRKFTGKLPERKEPEREIESLLAANFSESPEQKGTQDD